MKLKMMRFWALKYFLGTSFNLILVSRANIFDIKPQWCYFFKIKYCVCKKKNYTYQVLGQNEFSFKYKE